MDNKINLDNNYYLEIVNNINNDVAVDILKLRIKDVKKRNIVVLKINFNNFNKNNYVKILKRLLFIKKILVKNKIEIGMQEDSEKLLGYILNYDENSSEQKDFILAVNAIFYRTKYDRYNYIYDTVCNYLDDYFYEKNLCDFKNNKCGEKRNTSSNVGCCRHFENKCLGPLTKLTVCEYLNKENYTCDAKCLSCKLFTCDYLEKKGIKFKIREILLLHVFFNPLQKYFIKYMVFTPKEKIIKRLMML